MSTQTKPRSGSKWPARRYLIWGALALLVLVGGLGTWGVFTTIAGAVVAPGQIVVERNRVLVQHPDGGRVERILIDDGDRVSEGDLLIELDASQLSSTLTIKEGQLFETMARRARAMAESTGAEVVTFPAFLEERAQDAPEVAALMDAQRSLFEIRLESDAQAREQLGKQQTQIENQIEGFEAQREGLERQRALIQEEMASQKQLLEGGLTQAGRVLALEREAARLDGQVGELLAAQAQAETRISELQIAILNLSTRRREQASSDERDLNFRENELTETRNALIHQISRLEMRAPVSGVVYNFTPRSVIAPAEQVLAIVPQDRSLEIEVRVEPVHIDSVLLGQQVMLRFSSFDSRTTPELYGTVQKISADALVDPSGRPYYSATITLNAGEIDKLPPDDVLIPGMPVQAFLRTQDRTPIAYLTKPLTDYFAKAFRD